MKRQQISFVDTNMGIKRKKLKCHDRTCLYNFLTPFKCQHEFEWQHVYQNIKVSLPRVCVCFMEDKKTVTIHLELVTDQPRYEFIGEELVTQREFCLSATFDDKRHCWNFEIKTQDDKYKWSGCTGMKEMKALYDPCQLAMVDWIPTSQDPSTPASIKVSVEYCAVTVRQDETHMRKFQEAIVEHHKIQSFELYKHPALCMTKFKLHLFSNSNRKPFWYFPTSFDTLFSRDRCREWELNQMLARTQPALTELNNAEPYTYARTQEMLKSRQIPIPDTLDTLLDVRVKRRSKSKFCDAPIGPQLIPVSNMAKPSPKFLNAVAFAVMFSFGFGAKFSLGETADPLYYLFDPTTQRAVASN